MIDDWSSTVLPVTGNANQCHGHLSSVDLIHTCSSLIDFTYVIKTYRLYVMPCMVHIILQTSDLNSISNFP